jgi:glyoxylase-like metal-dependent hydrolase (beta-lactamase superfamily II)
MKIYAMSCGRLKSRKSIFLPQSDKDIIIEMPIPVFLITHPEGNVLFDTGPHPDVFKDAYARWGGLSKAFQPIGDENSGILAQLERINFQPDDIRYVVNSHLHFDHAGGNQFFPVATFLVSKKEFDFAKRPDNEGKGYYKDDWDHPLNYQELEGGFDIYGDGSLVVIPMPGHTPGHQILIIRQKGQQTIILSGDSVPLQENYNNLVVSRNNYDNEQAIESVKKLYAVVESEQAFLVHGHDSEQWWELKNHHPILRVPQP